VVHSFEASIPIGPLDPVSIAADIQCREPADAYGAHPTGKGLGVDTFRIVPPAHRAEQVSPRFVVQFRRVRSVIFDASSSPRFERRMRLLSRVHPPRLRDHAVFVAILRKIDSWSARTVRARTVENAHGHDAVDRDLGFRPYGAHPSWQTRSRFCARSRRRRHDRAIAEGALRDRRRMRRLEPRRRRCVKAMTLLTRRIEPRSVERPAPPMCGRYNPEGIDAKAFAGWVRP